MRPVPVTMIRLRAIQTVPARDVAAARVAGDHGDCDVL
jgi:hypothetical protein